VRLYLEGTNFRRIGRLLGINYQSAVNWINAYHQRLPSGESPVTAPETVELDEVFTFIGSKKRAPTSSQP
jgi:transposase-like protein